MSEKVFYSWQSDLPNSTNRGFIQTALEKAVKEIASDASIEVEPVVDRDTQGIAGSPDIAGTIFDKIDQAQVFVCDVSFINPDATNARQTPNPNVLLELGYALKALGTQRIIMVMNTAYGKIESLPFDLRLKRVLTYEMKKEDEDRATERNRLSGVLEGGLRIIFEHLKKEMPGEVIQPDPPISSLRSQLKAEVEQNQALLRSYKARLFEKIPSSGQSPPQPIYNFADLPAPTWSRALWEANISQANRVLSDNEFQKVLVFYSDLDAISGIKTSYQNCRQDEEHILEQKSDLIGRNMSVSSMRDGLVQHEKNVKYRKNLVWMDMIEVFNRCLSPENSIFSSSATS